MTKPVLRLVLSVVAVAAIAGVALASNMMDGVFGREPEVTRTTAIAAVRDVCLAPATPRAILREARRSTGEVVKGDAVPELVSENGQARWHIVKRIILDGRPAYIAVGDLSGGAMCRVYFQQDDAQVMADALPVQMVLGAPLGRPDDQGTLTRPGGWPFLGWHLDRNGGWRAVHYAHDPRSAWRQVEVTRGG